MTDMTGSRLWPLALMGWLAAFPPVPKEAAAATPPRVEGTEEAERCAHGAPGQRTAWLRAARIRYAILSTEERDRLRQTRRAARAEARPG